MNEKIQKKRIKLNKQIENIKLELEKLQNNCTHVDYKVTLYDFGSIESMQRICIYCGKILGEPNNTEIKNWKKYNLK